MTLGLKRDFNIAASISTFTRFLSETLQKYRSKKHIVLTKFQAKVRFDFAKKWLKPRGLENAVL